MHANVTAVLVVTIVAFLVVSGWALWQEFKPPLETHRTGTPMPIRTNVRSLGIANFLRMQLDRGIDVPTTPFRPSPEARGSRQIDYSRDRGENRTASTSPSTWITRVGPRNTGQRNPGSPRVTKPKPISLSYKGILKRPDGTMTALISNSKTGGSSFYSENATVYGATVLSYTEEAIELAMPDGSTVVLQTGSSVQLPGGSNGN